MPLHTNCKGIFSMAQLINTDGSIKKVEPKNGTDFELEELQKFVDGYRVHTLQTNRSR